MKKGFTPTPKSLVLGFTLIELLVVMAIIGVLVALAAGNFRTAQIRGRDAQRKSDLKEVSQALELYYADHKQYPTEGSLDLITGTGTFVDGNGTIYFKTLPKDPTKNYNYVYNIIDSSANQKYQLFARLENTQDKSIISGISTSCGVGGSCNFAITSPNTNATE